MKNYLLGSKKIFFNMVSTFVDFWAIFTEISAGRNFHYFFQLLRLWLPKKLIFCHNNGDLGPPKQFAIKN